MWFPILYELRFFSAGQLLIFTNSGFFFFFFLSGIYMVLQLALATLSLYYINWCFSLSVNFLSSPITFFFSLGYIQFFFVVPPPPLFFFVKSAFSPNCEYVITYIYFFLKSKNLKKFLQFGEATWRNHSA